MLRVQGGDYAVPINRVQEIVRVPEITRVPHDQAGVEGVINVRGRVLPVVDLVSRLARSSPARLAWRLSHTQRPRFAARKAV